MKIAYVLHQYLPFYNSGTEQYVHHLAKKLVARGEDVRIFCFEANFARNRPYTGLSEDVHDGIPVTRISGWSGLYPNYVLSQYYNPFYAKLFGEFLREGEIEVIHFFQNSYLSAALLEEAKVAGIPFTVNLMDFWYLCPRVQLLKNDGTLCKGPGTVRECIDCLAPHDANYGALLPYLEGKAAVPVEEAAFEHGDAEFLAASDPYHLVAAMGVRPYILRRTLALADEVISPSEFMKSLFVKNGYDPERIRIVRYGVEKEALSTANPPSSGEGFHVGYMGTISPHKGLHVLVRAFRSLKGEGVSLHVHGDMEPFPDYARKVREAAEEDERIRFHGRYEAARLPEVLAGIDLVVVPSLWYENTPFVVLEAMASGTPVAASDLGGLTELVQHGKNGLLFPAGDEAALGEALRRLAEEPARLAALRPDPSTVRSLDENAEEFLGIYRDLVSGRTDPERKEAMDLEPEQMEKKCELLARQTHYLTSQVFHMIRLNQGYTRRIAELERVVGDRIFLADHAFSEGEGPDIPPDLSPSIRRRLIQLEQVKAVLHRRNELVAELERQLDLQRANAERVEETIETLQEGNRKLREELEERERALEELQEHVRFLTEVVNRWWNNPIYKFLVRVKRLLRGGGDQ